jgi:hypothetical protein
MDVVETPGDTTAGELYSPGSSFNLEVNETWPTNH